MIFLNSAKKNQSEWYITSHTSIKFSQFNLHRKFPNSPYLYIPYMPQTQLYNRFLETRKNTVYLFARYRRFEGEFYGKPSIGIERSHMTTSTTFLKFAQKTSRNSI
jgi:hypothetical protein